MLLFIISCLEMYSNTVTACVLIEINIQENSNYWFKHFNTFIFFIFFQKHPFLKLVDGTHICFWPLTSIVHLYSFSILVNDCEYEYIWKQIPYCLWKCSVFCSMSDKSELKAELERKKQRIAQIREEKKRKEEEKKKKDVSTGFFVLHCKFLN